MGTKDKDDVLHKREEIKMRDEHAEKYGGFPFDDERYKRPLFSEIETKSILGLLEPKKGEVIADLGCGIGRFTAEVIKNGGKVIPLDFSFESLRKFDEGARTSASPIQGDVSNLPIKNDIVDKVLSVLVIQHLPTEEDMVRALKEMRRILKKGGRAVVSVLQRKKGYQRKIRLSKGLDLYCTLYDKKYLTDLAKRAVMRDVRIYSSNINNRIFNKLAHLFKGRTGKKLWINLNTFFSNLPIFNRHCEYLILTCKK